MAITAVQKIAEQSAGSNAGSSFATSGSLTPAVNKLYLAAVISRRGNTTANTPTLSGGGGLTWVQVGSSILVQDGSQSYRVTVFRAMKSSGLTSGVITADYAGQSQTKIQIHVAEFDGVDTSGTDGSGAIVQSNTGSSGTGVTTLSVTLSAFGDSTNNAAYGVFVHGANEATTPEGGYTELSDLNASAGTIGGEVEWKVGQDTGVSASWSTSSITAGFALEIKVGASVTTLSPASLSRTRALGTPVVSPQTAPAALARTRAQGTPVVSPTLGPASLSRTRALGSTSVMLVTTLSPASIARTRALGTPIASPTSVTTGLARTRALGALSVSPSLSQSGIARVRALGSPTIGLAGGDTAMATTHRPSSVTTAQQGYDWMIAHGYSVAEASKLKTQLLVMNGR